MNTTPALRATPALRTAVASFCEPVAEDHPCRDTVRALRRVILLGRARLVSPALRGVADDAVISLALRVCA